MIRAVMAQSYLLARAVGANVYRHRNGFQCRLWRVLVPGVFANGTMLGKSSNLPGPVSGIPIFYMKAHLRLAELHIEYST
jgi:hypothetical protein